MAGRRGKAVYADPRWRVAREAVLRRSGGRCERCRGAHSRLEVHHLRPVGGKYGPPSPADYDPSLLAAWCRDCHARETARANRRPETPAGAAWRALVEELT